MNVTRYNSIKFVAGILILHEIISSDDNTERDIRQAYKPAFEGFVIVV